jgi:glyoxylase-like metal-dependent hydrolase (beta-lactamase superfamily II)
METPTPSSGETHRIGRATVTRLPETTLTFPSPTALLPDWDPAAAASGREGLEPTEAVVLSVHAWLVRTERHVVLVDTGIGNGKRRASPLFDRLDTPWLARLQAAGVAPENVTHVLITHLHTDHVGWNTRRAEDGDAWVPTFPNARYLMPARGPALFESPEGRARPNYEIYADSVLPVIEAGLADLVPPEGGEVLDGFTYHPTPGHSPDHNSIAFRSAGEVALFAGDVVHHPVQIGRPEWGSVFCADAESARASRLWALAWASQEDATWFSSHFTGSSAGRVTRSGDGGFRWAFLPG